MGIESLSRYCEQRPELWTWCTGAGELRIAVDGCSFSGTLENRIAAWQCGGSTSRTYDLCLAFLQGCLRRGVQLYFLFDGVCGPEKDAENLRRASERQGSVQQLLKGRAASSTMIWPEFTRAVVLRCLAETGVLFEVATGEADVPLAVLAQDEGMHVASNDSDLMLAGGLGFIRMQELFAWALGEWRTLRCLPRHSLVAAIQDLFAREFAEEAEVQSFDEECLILWAALRGNDYLGKESSGPVLEALHQQRPRGLLAWRSPKVFGEQTVVLLAATVAGLADTSAEAIADELWGDEAPRIVEPLGRAIAFYTCIVHGCAAAVPEPLRLHGQEVSAGRLMGEHKAGLLELLTRGKYVCKVAVEDLDQPLGTHEVSYPIRLAAYRLLAAAVEDGAAQQWREERYPDPPRGRLRDVLVGAALHDVPQPPADYRLPGAGGPHSRKCVPGADPYFLQAMRWPSEKSDRSPMPLPEARHFLPLLALQFVAFRSEVVEMVWASVAAILVMLCASAEQRQDVLRRQGLPRPPSRAAVHDLALYRASLSDAQMLYETLGLQHGQEAPFGPVDMRSWYDGPFLYHVHHRATAEGLDVAELLGEQELATFFQLRDLLEECRITR